MTTPSIITQEADRSAAEAPCPVCRAPRKVWCGSGRELHLGRRLLRLAELQAVEPKRSEQEEVVDDLRRFGMVVR